MRSAIAPLERSRLIPITVSTETGGSGTRRLSAVRRDLFLGAAFCGVFGLMNIVILSQWIVVPFPDWLVFHSAAHAYFGGQQTLIYSIEGITEYQNQLYAEHLHTPLEFRPFMYPPTWLLMLLPFGLLGVAKAYGAFMLGTIAAASAAEGRRDWPGWLAVITSPAAVLVAIAGQNTFLSVALLYGGVRLLDRAPMAAGVLLGMLSYKPQVWVLVPIALVAARQWRALAATAATVAALSAMSVGVFGLDLWLSFVDLTREVAAPAMTDMLFTRMAVHLTTFMAAARIVGLPEVAGVIIQLLGTAFAAAAVWLAFRRSSPSDARTAVLATSTFLVSPYVMNYELLLLMPAVVGLYRQGATHGFLRGEQLFYALLWMMPLWGALLNLYGMPIMPVAIVVLGLIALARLHGTDRIEAARTVPASQTAGTA